MTPTLDDYLAPGVEQMTEAEREVYMAIENGSYGPREFARRTERSPGTVGNLLRRAREKIEGADG